MSVDGDQRTPRQDEGETPPLLSQSAARGVARQAAPRDLDGHWSRVYAYFAEKGLACIVLSRLFELLSLGFTIGFSSFLLMFVNWKELLTSSCHVDQPCWRNVHAFRQPFSSMGFKDFCVLLYIIVFSVYWLWKSMCLFGDVFGAWEMRQFYNSQVGISDKDLHGMDWNAVLQKVLQSRHDLDSGQATPLDIAARLMRKENYFIALVNRKLFDMRLPFLPAFLSSSPYKTIRLPSARELANSMLEDDLNPGAQLPASQLRQAPLNEALIWNLNFCIFDRMFGAMHRVHPDILNAESLRQRFRMMGIVNFVLMPFIAVFLLMRFFLHNAQQFYVQPASIGKRQWTTDAQWRFREFNELPHFFHRRLQAAAPLADKYISLFPSFALAMLAKFLAFVAGAFAAVLIVAGVLDQELLSSEWSGKPLWWWLAILGAVIAVCRSLALDDTEGDVSALFQEVVQHTHFLPRHWRGRATSPDVQSELSSLFQFKLLAFLQELAAVFLNPFILYYTLPRSAENIVEFIRSFTVDVHGLGHVCSFSLFDFFRHGNPKYGGQGGAKSMQTRQGKMEKSLATFMEAHPTFDPGDVGRQVLDNLHSQGAPSARDHAASSEHSSTCSFVSAMAHDPPLRSSVQMQSATRWQGGQVLC